MKYILAIDIGTTAFKAAIVNENGSICGSSTIEYTIDAPHAGWAEMDPETYLETLAKATRKAIAAARVDPEDILTIGMSTQGETSIILDHNYRPLRKAIVWFDTRSVREAQEIVDCFGADTIHKHTGQVGADAIWPAAKLLWIKKNEPEVFSKIGMVVQLEGYISYALTGRFVGEDSILGSSMYWDFTTRSYWPEMLSKLGLTEHQLPEILYPGEMVGTLTEEAAHRFGLSCKTTLNIGSMDLGCGAIGVGNVRPGIFSDSTGSALCTVTITDHPILDPNMQMPCYCGALPGQYLVHAYATGGMFMRWFRDEFCSAERMVESEGGMNAYAQLDAMASSVAPGCEGLIALPHLQGSGPPDQNAFAKASFIGITLANKKQHFVRAIMESVAMVLCRIIEATRALDIDIDYIVSYSGGARSKIWNQIKADATGLPVLTMTNDEHAACMGAAILAGTCIGIWDSVEDAASSIIHVEKRYEPIPENQAMYRCLLARYKELMDCLNPTFRL